MRAGVLHAVGDLRVEDRPDPVPGPGEVLLEVAYNGLCGTDASEFAHASRLVPLDTRHPGSGHQGPTVLGHEFVGTVVAAGRGAEDRIGSRVACGAGVSCGTCRWCRAGRTNLCRDYYTLGLSTHGGLAQLVAAPSAVCVDIADGCSFRAAALAQPLAVGIHAVRRSGLRPGDTVVINGVGAIGSFALAAMAGHDGEIMAIDVDPERLQTAASLGATATRLVPRQATADDVRDFVPGGADIVLETSGAPGGAGRALAAAVRGGTVLLVGLAESPESLGLAGVVLREVDIRTTVAHVCADDLPAALDLLADGDLAERMVDRTVPLEQVVSDGLRPLVTGLVRGKVLVDPRP
jgi:(R,R)-butanediol dehydrogenase/meso-butanediol dehydrogenase/diacetyl reductase